MKYMLSIAPMLNQSSVFLHYASIRRGLCRTIDDADIEMPTVIVIKLFCGELCGYIIIIVELICTHEFRTRSEKCFFINMYVVLCYNNYILILNCSYTAHCCYICTFSYIQSIHACLQHVKKIHASFNSSTSADFSVFICCQYGYMIINTISYELKAHVVS